MLHLEVINGPNLNLVGLREPEIYGNTTFEEYLEALRGRYLGELVIGYFQSNHEGALIDRLHEIGYGEAPQPAGIILNAGALSHTSLAIADAIRAIPTPVVEVHISNVYGREPYRQQSYCSGAVIGSINGLGLQGYRLAIEWFVDHLKAAGPVA